ncbi:hypothetical protein LINPERPRIM_LOCUS15303 [Linum perenne]
MVPAQSKPDTARHFVVSFYVGRQSFIQQLVNCGANTICQKQKFVSILFIHKEKAPYNTFDKTRFEIQS